MGNDLQTNVLDHLHAKVLAQEHVIQSQARLIEKLTSRGILGFFQRRRVRKMQEAGEAARYLKEDALRTENVILKGKLREPRCCGPKTDTGS